MGDNPAHGAAEGGAIPEEFYTSPEQAKDFVSRTGVDALAVAVGTAHGAYRFPPKLDFERITRIREAVDCPLVLHGGSGLTDADFREAVRRGIAKINIFTDVNAAAARAAHEGWPQRLRADRPHPRRGGGREAGGHGENAGLCPRR